MRPSSCNHLRLSRTIAVDDFFTDFYTTAMNANEILTEIRVPIPPAGTGTRLREIAASCFRLRRRQRRRIDHPPSFRLLRRPRGLPSAGSAAVPVRAIATEIELQGKPLTTQMIAAAAAKAAEETDPVEDSYASAEYKQHVATIYARKAIEAAVERAKG